MPYNIDRLTPNLEIWLRQTSDSPLNKFECENLTGILAGDIRPCSLLTIVGGTNALNNLPVNDHIPNLTLPNLGKRTNETIHTRNLFHLQLSLSFCHHYTSIIVICQ